MALVLGVVYVFWGSTAPAMKLAIATMPAFAMVSFRFFVAGAVLWAISRGRRIALPSGQEWASAALTGTILLVLGNALFCWSLATMPSGLGSLFFALSPLWMTLFAALLDRERVTTVAVAGLALGLAGMAVIYAPIAGHGLPAWAIALDTFTSLAWAFGSIVQRRFASTDLVQTSAMQMLCASVVCIAISLATHESPLFANASATSLASVAYLIVFGSIAGFSGYLWLTRNVPTALASTYAYVNPIVAIGIGTIFLHETLTWNSALGAGIVIAGVALILVAPKPRSIHVPAEAAGEAA